MYYFRDASTGSVQAMYGVQAHEAMGTNIVGSYNLYLGMENWLKISNTSSSPQSVTIVTTGPSGIAEQSFVISAHASLDIPLHQNIAYSCCPDSYGSVVVSSDSANALVSELVRARPAYNGLDFVMPTLVR
jgi:hypothetical protein